MRVVRMWWRVFFVLGIITSARAGLPIDTSPGDNSLWRSVITECKDMSVECIKTQFISYLSEAFQTRDVEIASFLHLKKNDVDYSDVQRNNTGLIDEDDELVTARAANPLEEVTNSVRDKVKEFFITHDVELTLPEFLSEGSVVRISPRSLTDGGALVKLELAPEDETARKSVGAPRLFKKLRKFIGERLMWALAALLLIVKLLSLKFMFFLPVIMGVAAAKKLLLKVILFIFPFLGHLFKLCPYYAPTKYHHHHHQISHYHKVPPHLHDLHAGGIVLDHPPPGWHSSGHDHEHHEAGHHHEFGHHHNLENTEHYEEGGYYSDYGPGYGAEELGLRRKQQALQEEDDGYGPYPPEVRPYKPARGGPPKVPPPPKKIKIGELSPAEIENMVLKAEKEAMLKARLQEEQKRVEVENKRLQDKIKTSLKLQEKLKIQSQIAKQTSKLAAVYQPPPPQIPQYVHGPFIPPPIQTAIPHTQALYPPPPIFNNPVSSLTAMQTQLQNSALHTQLTHANSNLNGNSNTNIHAVPANPLPSSLSAFSNTQQKANNNYNSNPNANSVVVDPFYSPILEKIDKIFKELVILDENCRERLVCNMYSDPEKYSPHSNLISAELSRDASELQKPTTSNSAVIRFYKYVQAARDGQDKRQCETLYPSCKLAL